MATLLLRDVTQCCVFTTKTFPSGRGYVSVIFIRNLIIMPNVVYGV